MSGPRTRFAPTPSGFLHEGNAANALLVAWLAADIDASITLRIDDMDATRSRPEYVEDIFKTLDWLEIPWDAGPRDPQDFADRHSQADRVTDYRDALDDARARGLEVYACRCSRRDIAGVAVGGCPGGCRDAGLPYEAGVSALRVHVPRGTVIDVGGHAMPLDVEMGDFVIWRRDDLPAYQLVTVVEDERLGITHIVRGGDLLASTAAQVYLAQWLDAPGFRSARVLHHPLVSGPDGTKLSKSQGGGPMVRDESTHRRVTAIAAELAGPLGIRPPARR